MFGLPRTTAVDKRIPKRKFYEKIPISPALKRDFIEQIRNVYWRNKIAAATVNVAAGATVTEVEVFEIELSGGALNEELLRQIDREIPYHIVFALEYGERHQLWISYKEPAAAGRVAFKVESCYHTDWLYENDFSLKIEGLDLDAVYENFVRQIAGNALRRGRDAAESLKRSVERETRRRRLEKQIDALENKIRREKQLNRRVEMNAELKNLRKTAEERS